LFYNSQVSKVTGNPARSKITIDVRYEILCDEDFGDTGDFGESKNCTQNSKLNSKTDAPQTIAESTTVQPTEEVTELTTQEVTETTTEEVTEATTEEVTEPTTEGTTSSPSTTSAPAADAPFACPSIGVYADPKDCHSYYRCDTISNPQHNTCIILTKYDPSTTGCSFGFC
jgi:cytoskeletal protein RodZ